MAEAEMKEGNVMQTRETRENQLFFRSRKCGFMERSQFRKGKIFRSKDVWKKTLFRKMRFIGLIIVLGATLCSDEFRENKNYNRDN